MKRQLEIVTWSEYFKHLFVFFVRPQWSFKIEIKERKVLRVS